MIAAIFLMHFFLCGPTDMYCEEGRMAHHSCAAAEAWLRAGLKPDQALVVAGCNGIDENNPSAAAEFEEPEPPLLSTRTATKGGR
jgi:hypothetical protein